MGDHYVPKFYLKGFTNNSDNLIWAYRNGSSKRFKVSLNNIGHEVDFYSPEVEEYLANEIEGPANDVIAKIRNREKITDEEKRILTEYLVVFYQRTPHGLNRFKERAPDTIEEMRSNLHQKIDEIKRNNPDKNALIKKRKEQIDQILNNFSNDPPKEAWLKYIKPDNLPKVKEAIAKKTWRFLTFDLQPAFITCDHPLFFFTGMGLGHKHSELTFPISKNVVLWATWRKDLEKGYFQTSGKLVTEFNNRIASNATRHIFFPMKETG